MLSVIMGMQEDTANCKPLRPLSIIPSRTIKPFFGVGREKWEAGLTQLESCQEEYLGHALSKWCLLLCVSELGSLTG